MTTMSRLARALVPRFGILGMAAAMLLVVSGAGWWTFHRDLYVEEREVVERALRAGASLRIDEADYWIEGESSDGPIPWDAPLRPPIEFVRSDGDLPVAVRDEFLRLPRLKNYFDNPDRPTALAWGSQTPTQELLERIDFALPCLPEPTIDEASLAAPLPDGPDLDAAETRAIADALFAAWNAPRPTDERMLIVSRYGLDHQTTADASPHVRVHWLEERRLFQYEAVTHGMAPDQEIATVDQGIKRTVQSAEGGWAKFGRESETDFELQRDFMRSFPYDDYPYHATEFEYLLETDRAIRNMPRFDLLRAAKIDDVRYRVEFAPFSIPRAKHEMKTHATDSSIDRWVVVVRSDLNWVPEEFELQASVDFLHWLPGKYQPGPVPLSRRGSQRFRKEGDQVVLVERLFQYHENAVPQGVWRGLYAVQRNPELNVDPLFDPDHFDPEPWPERRELPWLRWYRVTFALGCGIMLFLVGRRVATWRRGEGSETTDETTDETRSESLPENQEVRDEELAANEPA